jgi:hypothetical protein
VNHRKPYELGVASANRHSWLGSHVVPARLWFWSSTKKPSMTSSCCSCHHVARTWLRWPPGPSNEAYLSSPHLEASPVTTCRACSSPAPTPIKPQPAPAILSRESYSVLLSNLVFEKRARNNLCRYYVCEFIHHHSGNANDDSVSKINLLIVHHFYPFCIFYRLLYYINLFANYIGL